MGKSTSSCFKIITCGADSTDKDDLSPPPESKTSSDKRRWSFGKRSARHQIASNTVISEPQSVSYEKENSGVTTNNFYSAKDSFVPEKPPIVERVNETQPLPSFIVNSEVADTIVTVKNTDCNIQNIQEYDVVVIQAAIRGYLAQRELRKLKNVVKLQAAVRGHLVRRQAVGTLRCVQAIVKMQALVRARHARQSVEKSLAQEKIDENSQIDIQRSTVLVKKDPDMKADITSPSVEKLLSNGFARQLLESTPKTKPIHISCDPLKPDSAWKWLERWMAVTSSNIGEKQELNLNHSFLGEEKNDSLAASKELDVVPVTAVPIFSDSNVLPTESTVQTDGEEDLTTDSAGKIEFQALGYAPDQCNDSSANDDQSEGGVALGIKQEDLQETRTVNETSDSGQLSLQSDGTSHSVHSKNNEPVENLNNTTKMKACQSVDADGKNFELGTRKARNPAFAAVQAKFEELSSVPKVSRPTTGIESKLIHSQVETLPKIKELGLTERSGTQNSMVQIAASECGTEISISSTLDSPDRSEADGGEIVLEIGTPEEGDHDVNKCSETVYNPERVNAEVKNPSSDFTEFQQQRLIENDGDVNDVIACADSLLVEEHPVETTTTSSMQIQPEMIDQPAYRSSPEVSPRSHATVPESHGTPLSQISEHAKTSKTENNLSAKKQRSKVVGKSSPSYPKNDSGERHSTEHLPKDMKNAKRRNSYGMAKPDHLDHEPRISSSNSLPSYMQATESARAKVHGTLSLKASPDAHEKDNYMKKRHSLPIGDDKQGSSPRVQRSTSQTQQKAKGNAAHSPHNSAERRWQR